jgi:glycosyltransferase involved in cell wall biosynthesis
MANIVHTLWAGPNGGSENFAVNLANLQAERGHRVTIVNMNRRQPDETLKSKVNDNVRYVYLGGHNLLRSFAFRTDTFLKQHGKKSSLFDGLLCFELLKVFKKDKPVIIHSHLPESAFITAKALKKLKGVKIRHVYTDHGILLKSLKDYETSGDYPWKGFNEKLKFFIKSLDYIVTISSQQNAYWENKIKEGYNIKYSKIDNGLPINLTTVKDRKELAFNNNDFIFGMAGRGEEPSKGWELAINAFKLYNKVNGRLLLIGDGREIRRLQDLHRENSRITFTGMVKNPSDYLHFCDVGILLSTFGAESQPTTIIETLICEKPVISSNVGDIQNMLNTNQGFAGILLEVKKNGIDVTEAANAMTLMHENKEAYSSFKQNATLAARKFDMAVCLDRYEKEAYKIPLY